LGAHDPDYDKHFFLGCEAFIDISGDFTASFTGAEHIYNLRTLLRKVNSIALNGMASHMTESSMRKH
jgi:hypothetical protein